MTLGKVLFCLLHVFTSLCCCFIFRDLIRLRVRDLAMLALELSNMIVGLLADLIAIFQPAIVVW